MDTRPPYGYQDVVPLIKEHRVALRAERKIPSGFRNLNALPLSFTEFTVACRDYPIAFVGANTGSVIAMAVLGLERQQNLFATAEDDWDASVYLPAYVRRHPFCSSAFRSSGASSASFCSDTRYMPVIASGGP